MNHGENSLPETDRVTCSMERYRFGILLTSMFTLKRDVDYDEYTLYIYIYIYIYKVYAWLDEVYVATCVSGSGFQLTSNSYWNGNYNMPLVWLAVSS